jgi:predicted ABC-type ATPase
MRSRLIIIAGIQGAGKSTLADYIVENGLASNFIDVEKGKAVHVDIDEYVKAEEKSLDSLKPYYQNIAYEMANGKDVIITTSPSGIKGHMQKIHKSHGIDLNDKIEMLFMPCDLEIAKERCRERADQGGHAVNLELLSALYDRIPNFIKEVKQDGIPIYDVEYEKGKAPKVTNHNPENYKQRGVEK